MRQQFTDGRTGYHSVIVVRADTAIRNVGDLKNKVLSSASDTAALAELQKIGIGSDHFADVQFSGDHESSIRAVMNGDADAATTWTSGIGEWRDGYTAAPLKSWSIRVR